jgi:DNA sulfur modification protein DndD
MIFERLALHNFGIYRGRHEVELAPKAGKPIILFGGLNGGGKTTFLDALLLVLYGKFAACSNRGSLSYEEFLKRTINQNVNQSEGAALELTLQHWRHGDEESVHLHRSWRVVGKSVRETVDVTRNGVNDPLLADRWYEFVEELIPSRIANLFFFDGERIERYANPDAAAELMRSGVHALLGLDLLNMLDADLVTLERRRKSNLSPVEDRPRQQELERQLEASELERRAASERRAEWNTRLATLEKKKRNFESKYRGLGGDLYDRREEIRAQYERATRDRNQVEEAMRELASGLLPLWLVRGQLQRVHDQFASEREALQNEVIIALLEKRDKDIVDRLNRLGISSASKEKLARFLHDDRLERLTRTDAPRVLPGEIGELPKIDDADFEVARSQVLDLLSRGESLDQQIVSLERMLSSLPDPEGLSGVATQIRQVEDELLVVAHELRKSAETIDSLNVAVERRKRELDAFLHDGIKGRFLQEKSAKALEVIDRSRRIVAQLRERLSRRHLSRLEALIADSYRRLLRKRALAHSVRIDPDSYRLEVLDHEDKVIAQDRLSAGERQLLMVAMLWGLAKASGRPIPTVIDTPLSRLDGDHREKMVENYFPAASHQVILLSTDQEVDEDKFAKLSRKVTKAYRIEYGEDKRTSEIVDGYFWKGAA